MVVEAQSVPTRAEVSTENTWDLTIVFPDDSAWETAFAEIESREPALKALEGSLGQDASALLRVLQTRDETAMQLERIGVYARLRRDQDGTDASAQALNERAGSLAARIGAALAFVEPEILALPPETLAAWQQEEPSLAPYAYYLDHLSRLRPHVRSAEVESVMAQFRDITRGPGEISEVLRNTELIFPTIVDEDGKTVQLSNARYFTYVSSRDRRVRQEAFLGIHRSYGAMRRTFGTSLSTTVRSRVVSSRLRAYPSSLAAALTPNDIPVEVYHTLLDTVNANLPRLHRYLSVRRRILGLDDLHYYDLYAPIVPDLDDSFDYAEACEIVRGAFRPLGGEYGAALETALTSRWIDVYENVGKRSGAYSDGAYTTPPYVLLNYQGKLEDVYTLAHELGHALHSYFTRESQPYPTGDYTIFVAEVASTLAEALLTAHLLETRADPALRKELLVQQIEGIRTTIFRQTMFAEFELLMHKRAEKGEALTADTLSARYLDLVARYHGTNLVLDDEVEVEWVRIPHFYSSFYVYQYATGKAAATALAVQILTEGEPAVQRYLRFLRSGSSQSPIDLLRAAGVDMASPEPVQLAMDRFDQWLDELEAMG